jgi:Fe-S-cluster-containing dehydrogenase component
MTDKKSSERPLEGVSRRDFLKEAGREVCYIAILSGAAAAFLSRTRWASGQDGPEGGEASAPATKAPEKTVAKDDFPYDYKADEHLYVYLVDITKCIGCGSCVHACEVENDVPPDYFRTWVERYMVSRTGKVEVDSPTGGRDGFKRLLTGHKVSKAFFVPKLCNHCTKTPCVQLCPVGASYRSPDGLVLVDEERCMGCSYCVQACPYGSRFIHPETHTASKCTFCYHRVTRGLPTACVQACPVGARKLGDLRNPDDEVFEIIATKPVHVLKPELLTEPNCYYMGFTKEVK